MTLLHDKCLQNIKKNSIIIEKILNTNCIVTISMLEKKSNTV